MRIVSYNLHEISEPIFCTNKKDISNGRRLKILSSMLRVYKLIIDTGN